MTVSALPDMRAIRPILDMYLNSAVAVVGCHAVGISRPSCELDVLVVSSDSRSATTARLGHVPVDLFFPTEKEALKPSNPEYSVSLAFAKPLRDASLVLSTSFAANFAVLSDTSKKAARARLSSSLKALGRSEDALSRSSPREADFWLQAAAYDFAFAWVFSNELLPCPSHILGQLRTISKGIPRGFEAFSSGAGLERGSRKACELRSVGVGVIHDLIRRRREAGPADQSTWPVARTNVVEGKVRELSASAEVAECYSFLGLESLRAVGGLSRRGKGPVGDPGQGRITTIFLGDRKLLGDSLLSDLGFGRPAKVLDQAYGALREQVPRLARKL